MLHTNSLSLDSAPLLLTGTNDNKATNLKACTGECDNDAQCSYGLKCFQRSHGEPIPGCWGKGKGPGWDYCYDPTRMCCYAWFSVSKSMLLGSDTYVLLCVV